MATRAKKHTRTYVSRSSLDGIARRIHDMARSHKAAGAFLAELRSGRKNDAAIIRLAADMTEELQGLHRGWQDVSRFCKMDASFFPAEAWLEASTALQRLLTVATYLRSPASEISMTNPVGMAEDALDTVRRLSEPEVA